ncbi:hypothetical protein [Yersinia enterocolitica]|uniref:hypothetical protein n=1 Tax=Yersinia enterocolitica TaxID=630 RepID=UPI0005E322DF|nr:hypothetical protein [Yersinia enterocolitica]CNK98658.1 Uncharacterised protein [Yersinia intermedia]HDL7461642.1 hypothetical protein [Yersinia enterocolitica]HEN3460772.1 hypothetical protein [Yersinia enterocolitica]HEN3589284.1 hypothetical protein [Yersinia enterocolitica]
MLKELQLTKYDDDINTIVTYQPIPFAPEQGDAGYAIRVIEIYRLKKMAPLLEQFELLTGYATPRANCTSEEINSLVERGLIICQREESNVKKIEQKIQQLKIELNNAKRGVSSLSDYHENTRHLIADVQYKMENEHQYLEQAILEVSARKGLLGLLREQTESMLNNGVKGLKSKVMTLLPLDSLPARTYKEGTFNFGLKSHIYAWKELNILEKAIKSILDKCSIPNDKYLLSKGGRESAEFSMQYYRPESESIRKIMSVSEYVKDMKGKTDWIKRRLQELTQSL